MKGKSSRGVGGWGVGDCWAIMLITNMFATICKQHDYSIHDKRASNRSSLFKSKDK